MNGEHMIRLFTMVLLSALLFPVSAFTQENQQVNVSVKVIEFQTQKGVETGLSAYFRQHADPRPYGRVTGGNPAITAADVTFPSSTTSGITVFLDSLSNAWGQFEVVLQALVDQNRAFILSRPKALVPVGAAAPTVIQTVEEIPYESTVVVGATAQQVTEFRPTGVNLSVQAMKVVDDDGDFRSTDDTYLQLNLTATVNEEGQRITVALDDSTPGGGLLGNTSNAISVPEFISRSISTTIWVRHGQVLILGGLYRSTKSRDLKTLPWLTQGEDLFNGMVQRLSPVNVPEIPLSAGIGNQNIDEGRRELVFLVRAELWRPSYTVADEFGFQESSGTQKEDRKRPTDVITGVLGEISGIPQGIVEGLAGEKDNKGDVTSNLGGDKQ